MARGRIKENNNNGRQNNITGNKKKIMGETRKTDEQKKCRK